MSPFPRLVALPCAAVLLTACAAWTAGDPPRRTSVSLASPATSDRPEWLQRLVVRMDEEAFPHGGPLALKLSYRLARPAGA